MPQTERPHQGNHKTWKQGALLLYQAPFWAASQMTTNDRVSFRSICPLFETLLSLSNVVSVISDQLHMVMAHSQWLEHVCHVLGEILMENYSEWK